MKAEYLRVGQRFEIPSCAATYRNAVCLRISPSAVYARAEEYVPVTHTKKISKDVIVQETKMEWKPRKNYIGCGTEVTPLNEMVDVSKNEDNELVSSTGGTKGKRGRKGTKIEFPDTPFTIQEIADKEECSTTKVYLIVIAQIKTGDMMVVKEIPSKRGKSKKVYQVTNAVSALREKEAAQDLKKIKSKTKLKAKSKPKKVKTKTRRKK